MKDILKKVIIITFILPFFVSAIFCCCFAPEVQADEPAPSCHQSSEDAEPAQESADCDCAQSLVMVKNDSAEFSKLTKASTLDIKLQETKYFYYSSKASTFQTHPQPYDPSPLYIKHSILRI